MADDDELNHPGHHTSGVIVPSLVEGQLTFGRYRLKKLLGRGGFGVVWLAHDEELQMDVAFKFLSELLASDAEAVADLKRETRNSLKLTHANIMRIYGFVQGDNMAGISMEFVDGDTLSAMKVARSERCFNVQDLAPYVGQLCDALDYAHQKAQVVHRDLKPANLMINGRKELKIADFGISRSISDTHTRMTDFTSSSGTPAFMSPQQMMGESPSAFDDIYSMGATLYDLLSGKPPFYTGDIVQQVWRAVPPSIGERRRVLQIDAPPVPPEWDQVIAACLAKEPEARPQTAGVVAEFLGLRTPSTAGLSDYSPITLNTPLAKRQRDGKSTGRIVRDWVLLGGALVGLILTGLYARPPVAAVEPVALDFGAVPVGEGANQTFTITNTGGRSLDGDVLAACPDFLIVSGAGSYRLKSNQSLSVTVRFSPRQEGRSGCAVALDRGLTGHVTCTGTGEMSEEPVTPSDNAAGRGSGTATHDEGAGAVPPGGKPGTAPANAQVAPGASETSAAGVLIEPRHLDFGESPLGAESKPLQFTITNRGTELVSGRVQMDCPEFNFRSGDGEFKLKPGHTREVRIRFKPSSPGPKSCTVETGLGAVTLSALARAAEGATSAGTTTDGGSAALTKGDQVSIRSLVGKYEEALEELNAAKSAALWAPGRGPGRSFLEDRFARYKSQEVKLGLGEIRMDGAYAAAPITSRSTITLLDGTTQDVTQKGTIRFVRTRDGRWLIYELQLK
jgi:hypothetical protein